MKPVKLLILIACAAAFTDVLSAEEPSLESRYRKIREASGEYGSGGLSVLEMLHGAFLQKKYSLAGIEDLWATALKEGRTLFNKKELWGGTGPLQTGDMLGQTTIGPWQLTVENARSLGAIYGIQENWNDAEVIAFLRSRPQIQAAIAADFTEDSYTKLGRRAPLAIQKYFWLDAFVQRKIGQGLWYESVLSKSPDQMVNTGFYAKQLLLGSRFNPEGLLYWLYVTGDQSEIDRVLELWKREGHPIVKEDLLHCGCPAPFKQTMEDKLR